jgi:hypothetical protein
LERRTRSPIKTSVSSPNEEADMNIIVMVLVALLAVAPLLAVHVYAKMYVEPAVETSDDCKDPNARPGSRADKPVTMRLG